MSESERCAELQQLFLRNRERLRRVVAIRLAARLARVLEHAEAEVRGALPGTPVTEAEVLERLAEWVERAACATPDASGRAPEPARTLRFDTPDAEGDLRGRRADLERTIDARVAELVPDEYREVLLLRDYCGAGWELVRARLELLSVEAAQELYRRAHERLAQRMRPQLRKQA